MPKDFTWGRTVGHLKAPLLLSDCGIFWCSQRMALIDPHRLRGAFLGLLTGKKAPRRGAELFLRKPLSRHPKTPQVCFGHTS